MMILFHGSNVPIESIRLDLCSPNKDFGRGFYLTDIEVQAGQMALRRVRIAGTGRAVVSRYAFEETLLDSVELKIKIFDRQSKEWALFVMANREAEQTGFRHDYDIVIGPVADDGVAFQLERYARQLISLETLVEELTYRKLNRQYFFGTELSISKLRKL